MSKRRKEGAKAPLLWPWSEDFPELAVPIVLKYLDGAGLRTLRGADRAACAACDALVRAVAARAATWHPGALATIARFPKLRELTCAVSDAAAGDALAAALAQLPALSTLRLSFGSGVATPASLQAVAAALAGRSALRRLKLQFQGNMHDPVYGSIYGRSMPMAASNALGGAVGALAQLSELHLDWTDARWAAGSQWADPIPWAAAPGWIDSIEVLTLRGAPLLLLSPDCPAPSRLRSLTLASRGPNDVSSWLFHGAFYSWPWVTQLTSLRLLAVGEERCLLFDPEDDFVQAPPLLAQLPRLEVDLAGRLNNSLAAGPMAGAVNVLDEDGAWPGLRHLRLAGAHSTELLTGLCGAPFFTALESLEFSASAAVLAEPVIDATLFEPPPTTALTRLVLPLRLRYPPFKAVAAAWLPPLRSLSLDMHQLGGARGEGRGVRLLARTGMPHLVSLSLSSGMHADDVKTLALAPWFGGLTQLALRDSMLGPKAAARLACADAPALRSLALANTGLTPRALDSLNTARWLRRLCNLTLTDDLTYAGDLAACVKILADCGAPLGRLCARGRVEWRLAHGEEVAWGCRCDTDEREEGAWE